MKNAKGLLMAVAVLFFSGTAMGQVCENENIKLSVHSGQGPGGEDLIKVDLKDGYPELEFATELSSSTSEGGCFKVIEEDAPLSGSSILFGELKINTNIGLANTRCAGSYNSKAHLYLQIGYEAISETVTCTLF